MISDSDLGDPDKWLAFHQLGPECWLVDRELGDTAAVFNLAQSWREHVFGRRFRSVDMLADRAKTKIWAIAFAREDGIYDLRVFSRLRPGEYYDFSWSFQALPPAPISDASAEPGRSVIGSALERAIEVYRFAASQVVGRANAVWLIHPSKITVPTLPQDMNIRLFCAEIDETIDVNVAWLIVRYSETLRERDDRMLPWRRLLTWMARLKTIDSSAFGRISPPIKKFLDAANGKAQIESFSGASLGTWQKQGLLPAALAIIKPEDIGVLRSSIILQQGLARSPDFQMAYNNAPRIPQLLLSVDSAVLDPMDLQAFMTMGALRELHGFYERELEKLLLRRPDLQAVLQRPNGMTRLQEDGEVMALRVRPESMQEQQDAMDVELRKNGFYLPTAREMQMMALQQQNAMMQSVMIQDPMLFLMMGAAGMQAKGPSPQPPSPWKLYLPYIC